MRHKLTCLLLALFAMGCNGLHEYPNENPVDPTLVQMVFTLTIEPEALSSANPAPPSDNTAYDVRWIVEVQRNEFGENRTERFVTTSHPASGGLHTTTLQIPLHAAKYKVAAWADLVDAGSTHNKYYLTDALSSIRIATPYQGSCPGKAAFSKSCEVDLTAYRNQWSVRVEQPIVMQCPLARFYLLATDFDKFIEQEAARSARELSDLKVSIAYGGYLPSGFNVFTDKANDATTGIRFESTPVLLTNGKVLLGCDYIFVNGESSSITADITISDTEGRLLNHIEGLRIAVERGKPTILEEDFLTRDFSPGVGIDPGFDGDIDITIPD